MSMTVKMKDIIKFANAPLGIRTFTPAMNLAIAINAAAIEPHLKGYNEANKKLLEKYCEKDDKGNLVTVEDANGQSYYQFTDEKAYNEENEKLQEQEVELAVTTFKEKELIKCASDKDLDSPTVAETVVMLFMIERKDEK